MSNSEQTDRRDTASGPRREIVDNLRRAIKGGNDWTTSLLEAIAAWSLPKETYRGRRYYYFIAGEAFDWLLLAERLCQAVDGLLPKTEKEELLFNGRFPESFDPTDFRYLLGVQKYRAYLNFYYGVTVEEALQLSTELEVHKRHSSNGIRFRSDYTDEAYASIYMAPRSALLERFRQECGLPNRRYMGLSESREFTYWLFKHRLAVSDKARIASDTRKGLEMLQHMRAASRSSPGTG